ncbi:hypothetical protein CEF21_07275 [Bacillus sp. FJAT-42376]|nr:hypothetical protein CEF21_07275 [Bacillus sp. FJAT-42376]
MQHKDLQWKVPELSYGKISGDWHGASPAPLHRSGGRRPCALEALKDKDLQRKVPELSYGKISGDRPRPGPAFLSLL